MKQIALKGHSGCKIYLNIPSKGKPFVRKISKDIQYNERLRNQCNRQREYKSNYAYVPQVLEEGKINNLYYFDMEYIRGINMTFLLSSCSINTLDNIAKLLINIVNENKNKEQYYNTNVSDIVDKKLRKMSHTLSVFKDNKIIKSVFNMLSDNNWSKIVCSRSHGDLTLENIIYSNDGKFYLIDFLDTFIETWIGDVSKIYQDLLVGWSFRNEIIKTKPTSENIKVRVLLLGKQFSCMLSDIIDDNKIWEDIFCFLLFDLLRIIPYIQDEAIYSFVMKSMEEVLCIADKGGLYGHINSTMCWPIYEISRG